MTAIAGILCAAADPEGPPALARVMERMRSRGPDGEGAFHDGGAHLGGSGRAIAADALLVNREELLDALGIGAADDAEILSRAWAAWGEGMFDRVEGEFSFVLWDAPRRRLLCARDPFGTRPLYWLRAGGRFACASSARALLRTGWIPFRLHEPRIADALVDLLELRAPGETFFEGIHRLPAGRLLEVSEDRVAERAAGTVDPGRADPGRGRHEIAERFRDLFRKTVRGRLHGSPAAGAMLSGGLDSSSIVCVGRDLLRAEGGAPLRTFSVVSADEAACIEGPYIRAVLDGGGLDPVLVRPADLPRLVPALDRAAADFEEPFDAGVGIVTLLMFAAAREAGVDALLDGVDGDLATGIDLECVGHAAADGRWGLAWSLARGFGRHHGIPGAGIFAREALRPRVPGALLRLRRRFRPVPPAPDPMSESVIDPDFALRTGVRERLEEVRRTVYRPWGRGSAEARAHALHRATASWLSTALERYGRAAAAFGVEARHPFADRRLVEFCIALSWEEKARGGHPKALLRDALSDLLPPPVRDRRAAAGNLNGPFHVARLRLEGNGIRERVESDRKELAGFVDGAKLTRALDGFLAGGEGEETDALNTAMRLAGWLREVRREAAMVGSSGPY